MNFRNQKLQVDYGPVMKWIGTSLVLLVQLFTRFPSLKKEERNQQLLTSDLCPPFSKLCPCLCCSCPFLASNLTPAIPVIGGVLFSFVVGMLFRASFTDPGVLPRATPDEAADLERQIGEHQPQTWMSTRRRRALGCFLNTLSLFVSVIYNYLDGCVCLSM